MKKKILFIGSNPKNAGGIETFGRLLQEVFKESIHFYSFYKTDQKLYEVDNVKEIFPRKFIYRVFNKISKDSISNYFLNKLIPSYDILLINNPNDLKKIYKKNMEKKIILVQHQTSKSFLERKDYLNNNQKLIAKMRAEIDKLITLSPFDEQDFIEKFELSNEKVAYVRHCSKLEALESQKLKSKKLVTICRLVNKHKRIDLMLEAMKELPEYELEIWGDGPDKKELENKLEELNLKNVKFLGKTSNVKEKLDSASIFLMTSDYEGYPIAVIEAIRRGLPIVVRNTFVSAQDLVSSNGILLEKEWNRKRFVDSVKEIHNNYEKFIFGNYDISQKYNFLNFEKNWKKIIEEV